MILIIKITLLLTIHLQQNVNSEVMSPSTQQQKLKQSYYQSVASLDKYGQSQQIQNAMRASSIHGTPIIAALAENDKSIVVCYIKQRNKKLGIKHDEKRMVQIISCTDDDSNSNNNSNENDNQNDEKVECNKSMTAIICSGVKADGKVLIQMLREYSRKTWERYDTIPNILDITNEARDILLSFMGYSNNSDNNDIILKFVDDDEDSRDDLRMSRPFGIQSLLFGVTNTNNNKHPIIQSIDPSGITQSWVARALGSYSNDEVNKKLQCLWRRNMHINDVKTMCHDIFKDLYKKYEHNLMVVGSNNDDSVTMEIVYEILDGNDCTWNVDRRPFVIT